MRHLEPEDILRQALRAAAEAVEPAPEGLTQIRARLSTPRPLAFAWLLSGWETASQFVMLRLEAMLDWLANSLHTALRTADGLLYPAAERMRPLTERLRPALPWLIAAVAWVRRVIQPAQAGEERRVRYAWVRPAIAMAAVVLVAVVGGFALSGRLNQISQAASSVFSSGQTTTGKGGGTHNTKVNGGAPRPQPASGPSGKNGASPAPAHSCRPAAKAKPKPSPTVTPSTSSPTIQPTTPTPTSPSPSSPTPTTPAPTTPPPTSGPEQSPSTSSASATQSAQLSALVIIGARSGSAAATSPTPSPTCSSGGS
jgi:hypothetical protein